MFSTMGRKPELKDYGEVLKPNQALEPILARGVRDALTEWLTEIMCEDDLKAVGITARRKAIFDGPPGVGKTTLAHHLAARLGLNMVAVRPEKIIDCWLGSTARNIGGLFDAARESPKPVVLFIDEFDALGAGRHHEHGQGGATHERNAFVDTLLQRMEQHDGFIIAATNHGKEIDPAIWRRFDIHITLELPGKPECMRILARYLAPYGLARDELAALAEAFETASPALMRQFCEALKRYIILGPILKYDMRKEGIIERIVTAIQPHPSLGKPRLWSQKGADSAIRSMTWPLPLAANLATTAKPADDEPENIVALFPTKKESA